MGCADMQKLSVVELKEKARQLRISVIKMLSEAGSGHSGGSLGMADVFACVYFGGVMQYDPKNPDWSERDRFILSNGHICPIRYAAMAEAGFFPKEELLTLRKINSRLQGHPSITNLPGLESSNASLGQGLGIACGKALAARLDEKKHWVFCCISDGECDEGSTWEAVMFASHHKISNLIAFIDDNGTQMDGDSKNIIDLEPLEKKFQEFGWEAWACNGHDIPAILAAFEKAKALKSDKPRIIIFKTVIGKGVSFMEGKWQWHGKAPNKEETAQALKELGA